MSVIITNVSPADMPNEDEHTYVVRMNWGPTLTTFKHVRSEGLAKCLRRAADAVDAKFQEVLSVLPADAPDHS